MTMMTKEEERLRGFSIFTRPARNASHKALVARIIAGMHGAIDDLEERGVTIEKIWAALLTSTDERIQVAALTAFTRLGTQLSDQSAGEEGQVISAEPEPDGEAWLKQHRPHDA